MYKKILVALDGSDRSDKILRHTAELAEKLGAAVTLFHVVPSLPPYVNSAVDRFGSAQTSIIDELMQNGKEIIENAAKTISALGVQAVSDMTMGQPADKILIKAKEENFDLIIIGSRGLSQIKGYLMGSVSNRVSRHATCPVLIIR